MSNENVGIHQPTAQLPYLFIYPTKKDCRLLLSGKKSNESGCPLHPGSSCSNGLDSFVCEHAIK